MMNREFDLNIDKILEHWDLKHAVREIIANALDETHLSKCPDDIEIERDGNSYVIRDYGRGLRYEHFVQNENTEKLADPTVVGKFGIGLKDAIATFHRKGIDVVISSRHNVITIKRTTKHNFDDILTLHAEVRAPTDRKFRGTRFELRGIDDEVVDQAKELFLKFRDLAVLDTTKFGQILEKDDPDDKAFIYINGIKVAEEDNFLFHYNITSVTGPMRKELNRERNNLGRGVYSGRVKDILLHSSEVAVMKLLTEDLKSADKGGDHDEMKYLEVQRHAAAILNKEGTHVFLTKEQLENNTAIVDEMKQLGKEVLVVNEKLGEKIKRDGDTMTLEKFVAEREENHEVDVVDVSELGARERAIYAKTGDILRVINDGADHNFKVVISETLQKRIDEVNTVARNQGGTLYIKRSQLQSLPVYVGTLLHIYLLTTTPHREMTREFEWAITMTVGKLLADRL